MFWRRSSAARGWSHARPQLSAETRCSPGRDNPRLDQDPRLLLPQLRPERQAIRERKIQFHAALRDGSAPIALVQKASRRVFLCVLRAAPAWKGSRNRRLRVLRPACSSGVNRSQWSATTKAGCRSITGADAIRSRDQMRLSGHEIFRAASSSTVPSEARQAREIGHHGGSVTAEPYRAFPDARTQFSHAGVHLAATLLNDKANLHVLTLTSLSFFLCSAASTAAHQDKRSCRRSIARPRSAMVWLPPSAKIERDDRAGHGTICHLTNLD
jgi:hypothetical protein